MIKNVIRFSSYAIAMFGISALESCSKGDDDLCYRCTYDGDSYTYCYDDFKKYMTKAEFESYIDDLRAEGYTCKKK